MKMSIRVAVLAAVAALGALALAAPATAAYTKPTLEVTYTGTTTNIVASAVDVGTTTNDEDATYRATIYAPLGTTLTTNQAAGTVIGTVSAQVNALGLGGALLPLAGNIVVAAPGQVTPTQQAQCIQTQTPTVTWALVLQAAGQTLTVPAYVVATAGTETQLGPAKVVFCLTPPDVPTAQGGATFGAKFRQADLKVNGVFGTVNEGAWIAIWTPYFPLNGQPNAPATVASPAAIAPGQVTLAVAKSGRTRVRLTATLTQGGQPTAGAVQIFAGARRTALKRVKILKAGANGKATFTYAGKGIFFRLRGSAAARSAPPLCAALGALPAPCVNPTVTGFSELSAIVRRPA